MSRHRHGLVYGKCYPPHAGHHLVVDTAAEACDEVTVVVTAGHAESVPLADRVAWLRAAHAGQPGVAVVGLPSDVPLDLHSEPVWRAHLAAIRAAVRTAGRPALSAVFSSEGYGDELARRLGVIHVSVDPRRQVVPVSGTSCRADLAAAWAHLRPATRAGLAVRLVMLGAECTGTTTVTRAVAEHFQGRGGPWEQTRWVPEYGRDFTVQKWAAARDSAAAAGRSAPALAEVQWTADDFRHIARRQAQMEEAAAAAGSPLLVCDTDAFATRLWEYRYTGAAGTGAGAVARPAGGARVYLVTDHVGVPFLQDGLRDGEHVRAAMTGRFLDALVAAGHSWVLLTGALEERIDLAVRVADQLLARHLTLVEPVTFRCALP